MSPRENIAVTKVRVWLCRTIRTIQYMFLILIHLLNTTRTVLIPNLRMKLHKVTALLWKTLSVPFLLHICSAAFRVSSFILCLFFQLYFTLSNFFWNLHGSSIHPFSLLLVLNVECPWPSIPSRALHQKSISMWKGYYHTGSGSLQKNNVSKHSLALHL